MSLFRRGTPTAPVQPPDHPEWCQADEVDTSRSLIAEHGWMVVTVPSDETSPLTFHYTAGLTEHGLPELIVYGVPAPSGGDLLDELARRLVGGEAIEDGAPIGRLLEEDYMPQLRTAVRLQDPLGVAHELYGSRVSTRQLVLPDDQNRMPWDDAFDDDWWQPVLYSWRPTA